MSWFLVSKENTLQPPDGTYRDWKLILRAEGRSQCVYCAIGEYYFGGYRNYHVEHYRPKRKFPALTNIIRNLFYSCSICNAFKGSDWPNEPDDEFALAFYPDPSAVDYGAIFQVSPVSHVVAGTNTASSYVVERLFLNRPQLILHRRLLAVKKRMRALLDADPLRSATGTLGAVVNLARHSVDEAEVPPYEPGQIERP